MKSLPLFFCDQLVTIFSTTLLSIFRQDSDRPSLYLVGGVDLSFPNSEISMMAQDKPKVVLEPRSRWGLCAQHIIASVGSNACEILPKIFYADLGRRIS
ncbi:MAG: hypothetical protein M3410_00005 [Acidobacteriota bacterium]|nr:hypothetical protein [Acidobacteriota bacterium]